VSDAKTVVAGFPVTYVEVEPTTEDKGKWVVESSELRSMPVQGGLAADLCPGESDLIEYVTDGLKQVCEAFRAEAEATGQFVPGSVKVTPATDFNPNHDSLFVRFEHLELALSEISERINWADNEGVGKYMEAAEQLVAMIRKEVLK